MIAEILKITLRPCRNGDKKFYYIFFKSEEGESFKTCTSPDFRNYRKWKDIIENNRYGIKLGNLRLIRIRCEWFVDADSDFRIIESEVVNG